MDVRKIGVFIAENRKSKGLTQEQLGEKLGVTNKTVSRWETGKYMPDLSLLKPLSDELGVSINELLNGEKVESENIESIVENAQESIIKTIDHANRKIKMAKKIFVIVLIAVIVFFVLIISLFAIDINRMRNNEPVVFSTWGFSYVPPVDLKDEEMETAVKRYLTDKQDGENKHQKNEKSFAEIRTYFINEKESQKEYELYAWVLLENYHYENGVTKKESSISRPYKFVLVNTDSGFYVVDSRTTRDGIYYADDMQSIFPENVLNDMESVYTDGTTDKLEMDIAQQVQLYFK